MKEKNDNKAHNTFENKRRIIALGAARLKDGKISPEALSLGERFLPQIQSAYMPLVSVRHVSDAIGHGLFAEENLSQGAYVGEYTGHVRKNDQRYFQPLNNYCYEYPVLDPLGRPYVIDGTHGNLTRYINHSPTPNLRPLHVFAHNLFHLIFLALRPITSGEQLSYNYGPSYWYVRSPPHPLEAP